jgi:hypothetical protein
VERWDPAPGLHPIAADAGHEGGPTLPRDPGTAAAPTFGVHLTESTPPDGRDGSALAP